MKTGFSKVCINPPYGAPMVGYYEARFVKGIEQNLYARAVAFDDGCKKAVVIAVDVIGLTLDFCNMAKDAIAASTGIEKDAIFINFSHTHTGPLVGEDFASETKSSDAYNDFLITGIRDAAIYALDDLCESRFEVGDAEAKNISFIRRYRMKDGGVVTNPGAYNENIDHPLGTPDETVKLVKIVRDGSDDIFIINFGTHADAVGGEYINSDYMGYACSTLEKAIPGINCIFLLGPQGDVNHININPTKGEWNILEDKEAVCPHSVRHSQHMGRVIAGAVLSVCSVTEEINADRISYGVKEVQLPSYRENDKLDEARRIWTLHESGKDDELPYKGMELTTVIAEAKRIVGLENGPESFPFLISALRIGELVFAGIGGEPFTEIGVRISDASPFKNTIVCCLTNNSGSYIPTKSAYDEGGYEARASVLMPGGDDIIVEGVVELLKTL
ncbi:MAG: hypothetical protein IJO09_04030 [Oscillospiraceae bacterium]|nr:hypothetical protein [Oscillospiraceae bacterium]